MKPRPVATLQEVAAELGITWQAVQKLERSAFVKLARAGLARWVRPEGERARGERAG